MKLHAMLVSLMFCASVNAGMKETPPVDTGFDTLRTYAVEGDTEYVIRDRLTQRCYLYRGDENELRLLEPAPCPNI